jgi:putative tryptophan/tyrosine transport system substrate-binding protein
MERRTFLAGTGAVLLAAPLAAEAQQAGKVYKIGYLSSGLSSGSLGGKESFRQGLHALGYVEGRDFVIEDRWAEGHPERLPELAADLVRAQVDVIVTNGTTPTYAAMQATKTIPIVFGSAGNVVEKGIVASLARPGGNVTGLTFQLGYLKLYQLLKEAAPKVARGVYLYDPGNNPRDVAERLRSLAQAENVEWQSVALRDDPNGVAQAFAEFGRGRNGLLLDNSTPTLLKADQLCGLALQRRIPTVGRDRRYTGAGCLMSYTENANEMYRRAAGLVDRILKGAKPADLPVEMPTKFDLIINLKTAKALGLTIPPSLLQRADEIIQ